MDKDRNEVTLIAGSGDIGACKSDLRAGYDYIAGSGGIGACKSDLRTGYDYIAGSEIPHTGADSRLRG